MELLERAKTWWETLGITKSEAALVSSLIPVSEQGSPGPHPPCLNCNNKIDPRSLHDCLGVYDEVRYRLNDPLARSGRNRLMKKYGCEWDDLAPHIDKFFEKNAHKTPRLIKEFEELRKSSEYRQRMLEINWDMDEELWNS